MPFHCITTGCGKTVSNVDDVRMCTQCQLNGTAHRVHCKHKGSDPIDAAVAETEPRLPFVSLST